MFNVSSRIQTIAGIIFSLVFIAVLATMNSSVLQFGSNVNRRVSNTVSVSQHYELDVFDGTQVTGDTVISAINNKDTLTSGLQLNIIVDGTTVTGTYADSGLTINPNTVYNATLQRNLNDVITAVSFDRVS